MQTLINWTAKRAGASITINGTDAGTGKPVKVVGVDQIAAQQAGVLVPIATDKNGTQYQLA